MKVERAGTVAVQVNETSGAKEAAPPKPQPLQLPDDRDAVERMCLLSYRAKGAEREGANSILILGRKLPKMLLRQTKEGIFEVIK